MKQWEEIIKDRLIGYESPLPEDSLGQFRLRRQSAGQTQARKRLPLLWVSLAAAAAGLTTFVISHNFKNAYKCNEVIPQQMVETSTETIAPDSRDSMAIAVEDAPPVIKVKQPTASRILSDKQNVSYYAKDTATIGENPVCKAGHESDIETRHDNYGDKVPAQYPVIPELPVSVQEEMIWQDYETNVKPGMLPMTFSIMLAAGDIPISGSSIWQLLAPKMSSATSGKYHTHYQPVKFGLSASAPISNRLKITTGVDYSLFITSYNYRLSGTQMAESRQYAHYLGVPLRFNWTFVSTDKIDIYAGAGVETDFLVGARLGRSRVNSDGCIFSLLGSGGVQWNISKQFGLYLEPSLSWAMPSASRRLETYITENPCLFLVETGMRLNIAGK